MMRWIFTPAGFCLAFSFLFWGCGTPVYRLEGQVPAGIGQIGLLDSTASAALEAIHRDVVGAQENLAQQLVAALDSLEAAVSALDAPIQGAQRAHREAQEKYRQAFLPLLRFQSFGGNAIFGEEDAQVATQALLKEIANRFYKGRVFSLETEAEIRRYIQRTLQPLEQEVARTQGRVAQLRRSRSGRAEDRSGLEAVFEERRQSLVAEANQQILNVLQARQIALSEVDSSGRYRFEKLPLTEYYLYAPHPLPDGFLVPVSLSGHTRQDLGAENMRRLLVVLEDN